jgi:hypothetical protein
MYASSRLPRAAAINETACSSVSDFDAARPNCPFGGLTSAATFRPARSSRSACRIARTKQVMRDLHRPRRPPRRQVSQRLLHDPRRQRGQLDRPQFLTQRLRNRVPIQGHRRRRQPVQPSRQPVIQSIAHRVMPPRPHPAIDPGMQFAQRVPDLSLGPAHNLLANPRSRRAVPETHRADELVLGLVAVDRVLAAPATFARNDRLAFRYTSEDTRNALTWRARQDSNPRPAA